MKRAKPEEQRLFAAAALTVALATTAAVPPGRSIARASAADEPRPSREKLRAALERHPLQTLDGRKVSYADLQGHVVVLNFWASWCAPCRHELPGLNALDAALARDGGRVLAISIDEQDRNVQRFVREHALSMPVVRDGPNGIARDLALRHIPYTLILDRAGTVVFTSSGAGDDAVAQVSTLARRLTADSQPSAASSPGGAP